MKKTNCQTLLYFDENDQPVYKNKQKFDTLEDAIKQAKIMNSQEHRIHKVVSYKCDQCHKYHIGKNGKALKDKDKQKYQKELHIPTKEEIQKIKQRIFKSDIEHANFKVVGKIDLSKIKY